MPFLGTCISCEESRPVHRKVAIADSQGVILDSGFFCESCWKQLAVVKAIDSLGLVDGK